MKNKILLTIVPKDSWIVLIGAILAALIGGIFSKFGNLGFNIVAFILAIKLAILFHEIGHLLFAKLVGGTPRRLTLGRGHKVFETKILGIKLILKSIFNSGFAFAAFDNLKHIKSKLMIYNSGGFLINFLIVGFLFSFFDLSFDFSSGIKILTVFGFANLYVGVIALLPFKFMYQGIKYYSDGLSLFKIPFYKKSKVLEIISMNDLLDAFDFLESKHYEEALVKYNKIQSSNEDLKIVNMNLSIVHVKLGNYQLAAELLEEILPLVDEEPYENYKAIIYNAVAWVYLVLNNIDDADKYSSLAYKIDSRNDHVRGTRASVLIEKGDFEKGKNALIKEVDFNFPNNITLSAAIYVCLAFHGLNESSKAEKYVIFIEENLSHLDVDERVL